MKALILGHDTRSFLGVIRSLGRGGIAVHVGWHEPGSPAIRSRYVTKVHDIPPYRKDNLAWKTALIELMSRERFDLIIPCHDSSLVPLHEHRGELEAYGRMALPSAEAYRVLFDKVRTNELARKLGIAVPRERVVKNNDDIGQVRNEFRLPAVLKPCASFNPDEPEGRNQVQKAYTWNDFDSHLTEMLRIGPVAIQENFVGVGVGVELLLDQGRPLMVFQHVRVHEPLQGGGSSYRRSVPVSPDLLDACVKLLAHLRYTGAAMVEFKVNPATGEWVLIEVNARFWGSLPLALAAGADFPLALFDLLVERRRPPVKPYRANLYCRNWHADFNWQFANLRADHADPTLASRPVWKIIRDAVCNFCLLRERSDTLCWDDPLPALSELREMIGEKASGLYQKLWRRYLQHSLVRSRARNRALSLAKTARSVLFVCSGNICRSPFAEHLLRIHLGDEITVHSAGFSSRTGRKVPELALAAAREHAIDLSSHRSQSVTASQLDHSDMVIVFDFTNYEKLLAKFPYVRDKVAFLGVLEPDQSLFIDDPWGAGKQVYQQIYRRTAAAVEKLAKPMGRLLNKRDSFGQMAPRSEAG